MITKILKNQTSPAVDIILKQPGVTIPASGTYTIELKEYALWTALDVVSEITPFINSGDIVVNDGVRDLTAVEGIRYIEKVETVDIQINGADVTKSPIKLNFEGDVTVQNISGGEAKVTVGESGTAVGKLYVVTGFGTGVTGDKWLNVEHPTATSDETPFEMPGGGNAIAVTYSNTNDSSECDVKFYVNGTLQFTWEIRNKRTAYKILNAGMFTVLQGDRVSIYLEDVTGTSSKDPTINLSFTINSMSDGEGGQINGD